MKQNVLITGCDGYIGHALTLKLVKDGHSVVGIDNLARRHNVKSMGSISAIPIETRTERNDTLQHIGNFVYHDLTVISDINMRNLFKSYRFDTVINLAQQPSAPWSHKSQFHTLATTVNNLQGVINLLYAMKDISPDSHLIHIGTMGEYDPAVGVKIPEGTFKFWHRFKRSKTSIFPRRPGSFYHASKVAATYYIDLACRAWGLKATDIMQGVVFGNWTPEIEEYQSHTRLDTDEAFGTVSNRFIVQAFIEHPLTIYGKGHHKRGFLSLYDSIQCLNIALNNPPKSGAYRTWNQLFSVYSINQIADLVIDAASYFGIKATKQYIPSPRKETTNPHYYNPDVKILRKLGYIPEHDTRHSFRDELFFQLEELQKYTHAPKYYETLKNVVKPKITWS
jgi:nucleoside-diphosphate-sugar epimerase